MLDIRLIDDDTLDALLAPFGMHLEVMPVDMFDEDDLDFIEAMFQDNEDAEDV